MALEYVELTLNLEEVDFFWDKVSEAVKDYLEKIEGYISLGIKTKSLRNNEDFKINIQWNNYMTETLAIGVRVVDTGNNNVTSAFNQRFLGTIIHCLIHDLDITRNICGIKLVAKVSDYNIIRNECRIIFDITIDRSEFEKRARHCLKSINCT